MKTVPLKAVVSINDDKLAEDTPPDHLIRYVDISAVVEGCVAGPVLELPFEDAPSRARRLAMTGDVVVSTVRTYLRAITPVEPGYSDCVWSTGFAILRSRDIEPAYLRYAVTSSRFLDEVVARSVGVSYPAITATELGAIPVVLPTPDDQRRIAQFLDAETAQIDSMVRIRERQRALVGERVDAIINEALSRNERSVQLRRGLRRIEQGWSPECDSRPAADDEWGVLRAGAVNGGIFRFDDNKFLPTALHDTAPQDLQVRPGDLVMNRASGSLDLLGSVALAPREVPRRRLLSDKLFRLGLDPEQFDARFVQIALSTRSVRDQIRLAASGGNGLANNLPMGAVKGLRIPAPPLPEQQLLASEIEERRLAALALTAAIDRQIVLLNERRRALVTATVTGSDGPPAKAAA